MITEDYISFDTAKLLKDKEFNIPLLTFYITDEERKESDFQIMAFTDDKIDNNYSDHCYLAPTLQMAMKWLREIHDCPIEILWNWDADSQCSDWYFVHHMELKPLPRIQYYETYEEAAEAAIKYCLENLI